MNPSGTWESMELLGRLIDGIRIRAAGAATRYSIPLPENIPLAGMLRQGIKLPTDML